jgi:hypothetical protein
MTRTNTKRKLSVAKRNGRPIHETAAGPVLRQSQVKEPFRFLPMDEPGFLARLFNRRSR